MILKKFVPLYLLAIVFATLSNGQVHTNTSVLQQASLKAAQSRQLLDIRLLQFSRQKGWPLFVRYRNRQAVLTGIDPKGFPLYTSTNDNIISAATIGTNQLWPGGNTGLNLNGSSSNMKGKLAIWDGGRVLATHVELNGRILQKDNPSALSDHATHVSGTMIAAGVNPVAKGMAFAAPQLIAYDFNNDVSEMFAESPDLLLSNHSYGEDAGWNYNSDQSRWEFLGLPNDTADYKFGYYSDYAQSWDSIAYNAPGYLIVKSAGNNRSENGPDVGQPYYRYNASGTIAAAGNRPAGISNNDGYDIIPTFGVAKNILTMGAVNPIPAGYSKPADVVITDFSSWGPTDDGRIKPELVADGVDVLSSVSTANDAYAVFSGTSMSSPAATGSSFLLQEYYSKLNGGAFMRSATLKGLLIHSADEAGAAPGPDFQNGYGLIDMPKAAAVITSKNTDQLIYEKNLINGNSFSIPLIASGKGPLMATICWTDPPAKPDTGNLLNIRKKKLINDLDLRITDGSNTFKPWILDWKNPGNPATTGDDSLNNVEKIELDNAVPGKTYTLNITHKGVLARGQQAYSVIISGAGGQAYCVSAAGSSAGGRIDNVTISNINNNNPAGCTTYTDYTSKTILLQSSETFPFSIKLSSCDGTTASKLVKIYIDYNQNGLFTDSGELVAFSPVISGDGFFTGSITVPAGIKTGSSTLMRIVTVEATDTSLVQPCGIYGRGETEDYRINFTAPGNDVGISAIVDPEPIFCIADSQRISVRIKNFGTNPQVNIPVTLLLTNGAAIISSINTVCADTIPALSDVIYTFQTAFAAVAGTQYTVAAYAHLSGDQDSSNNGITENITVSNGSSAPSGEAEICSSNPPDVALLANVSTPDLAFWYDSPSATQPIATGNKTSTNIITDQKTYYLALNDLKTSIGPKSKLDFPGGSYVPNPGDFISFSNQVPLTISSARLYIGHAGSITFIVGDLASFDSTTGIGSYYPVSTNTINVYATNPNPALGTIVGNPANDSGAVFFLNIPVPETGNHILIIRCNDNASIFENDNIPSNPYPFAIPGLFAITGNTRRHVPITDTTSYQKSYLAFYNMQLNTGSCPSGRVPVVASSSPAAPIISQNGKILTSNIVTGNQWYLNDTAIAGATAQTYVLFKPGNYTDVVEDSVGCSAVSNVIAYSPGSDINLTIGPNPNNGSFKLQFYSGAVNDVEISLLNTIGQRVYAKSYPGFAGLFSAQINAGLLSTGVYILKLQIGSQKYTRKLLIQ